MFPAGKITRYKRDKGTLTKPLYIYGHTLFPPVEKRLNRKSPFRDLTEGGLSVQKNLLSTVFRPVSRFDGLILNQLSYIKIRGYIFEPFFI